jgi:hypothetical protein
MYLVIYPEGTRYTDRRKVSSDAVAREKGHAIYESELLLPRTKVSERERAAALAAAAGGVKATRQALPAHVCIQGKPRGELK